MIGGDEYVNILSNMILIRRFEETVARIAENKEIQCPVHLYVGQEAIAATVCSLLDNNDLVYSTHRSHGHYLAKGGDVKRLMAEIYCRESGCSRGRGGSMHVIDRSVGFMASSAIVGGTIANAVGSALSIKLNDAPQISVAFFGDGATDEGVFYESLNFAIINNLPVLFVCENNGFSTHMPDFLRQSNPCVTERIKGFKITSACVDGNNPIDIRNALLGILEGMRNGEGPAFIECSTYRWLSHVGWWQDLDVGFRTKDDVLSWRKRCPIGFLRNRLLEEDVLSESEIDDLDKKIVNRIEDSVVFARESSTPLSSELSEGLFS